MVSNTLLGCQVDLLPSKAVKQVCRARREGNLTAGLQKMSQTEAWRQLRDGEDLQSLEPLGDPSHPCGGCSLVLTDQLCCRIDTMTRSRAVLAWCYQKALLIYVVHVLSHPSWPGPAHLTAASLTQDPFPSETRSLRRKLWTNSQELILRDGTDYMIMA